MMHITSLGVVLAATQVAAVRLPQSQAQTRQVLDYRIPTSANAAHAGAQVVVAATSATRKLTGRFLHITDIHPDPYYKTHSSTNAPGACHRGKGVAGYYGAETSDCDTPLTLVNATFDWIKAHIRDDVDFVIWTGDSARHDNDERVPRSRAQVMEQNALIERKFRDVFGRDDDDDQDPTNDFIVPIVPTLGNNDILPHNIFEKGPNYWTSKYLDLWRSMIPEHERHSFARGGWFSVEAIPNKLAVFSLNTLYFFTSNGAVDGCAVKKQPGHEQFEWLRIQLDILRSRGMKAILIGHVPPARVDTKVSWDETCWQKYTLWSHKYRDVIIAGLYGHMNIDHFMLQDAKAVKKHVRKGYEYASEEALTEVKAVKKHAGFSVTSAQDYLQSLRSAFARIPAPNSASDVGEEQDKDRHDGGAAVKKPKKGKKGGIGGEYAERYSLTFVSPSVVPNYFPSLRVFSYNISGLESLEVPAHSRRDSPLPSHQTDSADDLDPDDHLSRVEDDLDDNEPSESHLELRALSSPHDDTVSIDKKKKKKKKKKAKRYRFVVPKGPSSSSPPGPAYSSQPLTFLGYKQYYANLTYLNNDFTHDNEKEWSAQSSLASFSNDDTPPSNTTLALWSDGAADVGTHKWKPGKHRDKKPKHPHPKPLPFTFKVEYDTQSKQDAFRLEDLTVRSYVQLAARIAGTEKKKKGRGEKSDDADVEAAEDESTRDDARDLEEERQMQKPRKRKKNKAWNVFLNRAFVGALDAVDLAGLADLD